MPETAKTSEPVEFDGNAATLRNTIWIAKEDFYPDQVIVLTIKKVVRFKDVIWRGGRKADGLVPAFEFEGTDRYTAWDAESRDSMIAAFGLKTSEWKGKKVELYVRDGLTGGDGTGKGVRVRPWHETERKSKKE